MNRRRYDCWGGHRQYEINNRITAGHRGESRTVDTRCNQGLGPKDVSITLANVCRGVSKDGRINSDINWIGYVNTTVAAYCNGV